MSSEEVRAEVDLDTVIEALIAPLYLRLLVTYQPIDRALVDRVVDVVLEGVTPDDHSATADR